ncbi:MAG: ATP-grasp domain-containing protein [Pseudonocardiaceae bacterium]
MCGIPSETSLAMVAEALTRREIAHVMVNQRQVRTLAVELSVDDEGLHGRLTGPDSCIDLTSVTGVYLRFMDDRWLPELEDEPPEAPARVAARAFHELIGHWADVTSARVINRYVAMGSNFSKPYQLQLIREHGFAVPETLVTNDPGRVTEFRDKHGPLIYKSISSERSIVSRLDDHDITRLERIRWCPVQFQEFVPGPNLRVHTVSHEVFATVIDTDAVDYRYAIRQTGSAAAFAPYDLGDELAERCVRLASALGLEVAGLDLKLAPDGRVVCLEVNPSPVFSYYELHTGQPIADAVARLLNDSVQSPALCARGADTLDIKA